MYSKIIHLHSLNGEVAQSVEQKTENLCVGGSIPSLTTQGKKPFRFLKGFFIFCLSNLFNETAGGSGVGSVAGRW